MCGIFATTRADTWLDHIDSVIGLLKHRGPDDQGWAIEGLGENALLFAQTRLEVIGLGDPGKQPARSSDGRLVLVFNGEIYNYQTLGRTSSAGEPRSDTQVLANRLRALGADGVTGLRGMYAFAAYDRERDTVLAGRDPFGMKPLYHLRHSDGGHTFASELPPLLLHSDARRIDRVGLAHYLAFGHTGQALTMFERITKVPPGVVVQLRRSEGDWSVTLHSFDAPEENGEPTLSEALEQTVRAHLVADVEVGVFLSGGIDSTLLAAIASKHAPTQTFTIAFPEAAAVDESALASANAKALGLPHAIVQVTASDMAAAARRFIEIHGEAFGDPAALPLTCLAARAAETHKVVLAGEGADELFAGYGRYRIERILNNRLTRVLQAGGLGSLAARYRTDRPRDRAATALLSGPGFQAHAVLLGSDIGYLGRRDVPYAREAFAYGRAEWLGASGDGQVATGRRYDLLQWLPNMFLEKSDRATMAHSLEARLPYLDGPLSSTVRRLEPRDKSGLHDELLARLPQPSLPSRKKGLAVPIDDVLAQGLVGHANAELRSDDGCVATFLGHEWQQALTRRARRSPTTRFRLAMLGLWNEMFGATTFS